jgi:hypothetical protein
MTKEERDAVAEKQMTFRPQDPIELEDRLIRCRQILAGLGHTEYDIRPRVRVAWTNRNGTC